MTNQYPAHVNAAAAIGLGLFFGGVWLQFGVPSVIMLFGAILLAYAGNSTQ